MANSASWKPFEITPESIGGSEITVLLDYLSDTGRIDELLCQEKAILFRRFGIPVTQLETAVDLLLRNRLAYVHGNTPRTKVGNNVYTSTEYPSEFNISMHNELSYAARWPSRLLFFCEVAPTTGGATLLTDASNWLASLDGEVREAFADGVCYVQNLHGGLGLGRGWPDTFETSDRPAVEAYLSSVGAMWEWREDDLRIRQVRPATTRHPVTGAEVWFNQADQWHITALDKETAAALIDLMPEDEMPMSVRFADGSPIPGEYVLQVRDRGFETAVDVEWQAGDLLVIDNVLVAHGRRSFTGSRRVLVAMSD